MLDSNKDNIASTLVEVLLNAIRQDDIDDKLAKFFGLARLSKSEIETLRELSEEDRRRLVRSGHIIVNVTLNRRNIESVISLVKESRSRTALIHSLVKANAPQSMMYHYFGTSTAEMARLRREAGMKVSGGRPGKPTEAEETKIYTLYLAESSRYGKSTDGHVQFSSVAQAEICLRIHQKTDVSLAKVYQFIRSLEATA